MKKELQNKDNGLGFLRHWKVMTMTLLLLTFSIGQMWADTFTAAEIAAKSGSENVGTTKNHVTVSLPGITATSNVNYAKISGTQKKRDMVEVSGKATSGSITTDKVLSVKVDRGYKLVSPVKINGSSSSTSDIKMAYVGWQGQPEASFQLCNGATDWKFDKNSITSEPVDREIAFATTIRAIYLYTQIKTATDSYNSFGTSKTVGSGTKAYVYTVDASAVLAPEIEGESQMWNNETIELVGYPTGGAWAVVSGPGSIASDGKLTANGNGTIRVSYTVDAVSGIKDIVAGTTKQYTWLFNTNNVMPTTIDITAQKSGGSFESQGQLKLGSNGDYAYIDLTSLNYLVTAAVINGKTGSTGDGKNIGFGSAASNTQDGTTADATESTYTDYAVTPTKSSSIFSVIKTSGTSAYIASITLTVKKAVFHTLSYAVAPTGKGTVTLGANSVREGLTTTATYSAIDAAYEFDEWQISGTGATLSSTSTNPTTITMGSTDATVTLKLKAAVTKYTITYSPGANGTGAAIPDGKKDEGVDFTLSDATYSRDGYVQTGWATEDGGAKAYDLGGTYTTDDDLELFPFWTPVYTVTKGTHEHGDFTISPASLVAGGTVTLDPTPADGYMFSAWEIVKTSDASATGITVTNKQFEMPAYGVTVNATFVADTRKKILYLTSATTEGDKLYEALKDDYNVTVAAPEAQTLTNYDLVVLHESIGGNTAESGNDSKKKQVILDIPTTTIPVLNTKSYFYTSARWNWGGAANGKKTKGMHVNTAYCNIASHPLFDGLTPDANDSIIILSSINGDNKPMQPVTSFTSGKEGYTLANVPDGCAIHELTPTQRGVASGKYLLISVYNKDLNNLNANGQKLFKNAAAYLLDGDASWAPATAPTSPAIEATGGAIHAVGDAVTMTASASNVSTTTLYAWYKGETLEAAEEAGAIQTAKTAAAGGTTYSIASCELASAGRYWCVIVNAEGCEASASFELSVSSTPITTYDITYVSAKGTAPDAENAASVTLAEITGVSGWEHQGWKANVDVVVDEATVTANTLIANGKTAVLSADVTFTAVWRQVLTVTYNANGGTCGTASATWGEGDAALVLPDATVANLVFDGWYTEATGGTLIGRAGGTYTPTADIEIFAHFGAKLYQAVYANGFDAFINQSTKTVTVYYLDGTPAPALTSVKAMKADGSAVADGTFVDNGATIDVTIDEKTATYTVTKTAVAPYTYVNGDPITFDGTETYIKTGNAFSTASGKEGWKFSKNDNDWSRETPGNNRIYFFIGAAESITLTSGCSSARAIKVYRNGTQIFDNTMPKNSASPNYITLTGSNAPAMYAIVSNQTDGDGAIKIMALAPWVSTTAVVLKEGESAISEKEIWAGANFTLTAEVTPDNASNKTITWTSSNPAVATVVNGVVTGVAANATPVTITASTVDGVTATCAVTVTAAPEPCETPVITADPASQAYCAGSEPTLTVAANDPSDGGTLHYAWYKVGDPDAAVGTDAASYTVESAGTYYVIVTNKKDGSLDASATSSNAVVTMNVAAAITTQPTGKSEVVSGSEVTLSVVATNATGYQWYICDDAEKANASAISGAEAADYVFNCSASAYYYCVVGSACGDDITSNVVSVKLEPANCNLIASIPDDEPYQYVQTGEWTLYGIDSNGRIATSNKFKSNAKDFDGNTVNAIEDQRIGMIFDKDIESLTIYATSGSTGRTWKGDQQIRVTSDDITSGSPSYTNVTATRAVATMPTNNKQYIFTADEMLIEAGKKVWLPFSGSITIFKICYTAALEKCDAPVLPSLASKELCEGEAITAWDATSTVSDGGALSYQWYNGDTDEALSGEDDAEFTPSADGNYYVIVTNKKTGYRDNTTKSATLSVEHFAGTAITEGLVDLRGVEATVVTLTVTATGKALHYAWKESATIDGTYTDVAGAADAASLDVTITDGMSKYYKVVVSGGCGAAQESIAKVEEYVAVSQQDVTGSIVWDWTEAASVNEIKLTSGTTPKKNEGFVMANGAATIYNNANFESDKLYLEGEYIVRDSKFFQGQTIKFNTTVDGLVRVKFSHTGDSKPARELFINGVGTGDSRTSATAAWSRYVEVPAGEVVITAYHVDPADGAGQQYIRVPEIEFLALENRRTAGWIKPGELGTVCLENTSIVEGATIYELQGPDQYGKLVFDEVQSGEVVAGTPYLFEATATGQVSFYKKVNAAHAGEAGELNGMHGTFSGETFSPSDGNAANLYYFSGNAIWCVANRSTAANIPAHGCYLNMEEFRELPIPSPTPAPGRRRITLGVNGKNTPTGLENGELINGENGVQKVLINGELFILRGEKMYDATGRLVK